MLSLRQHVMQLSDAAAIAGRDPDVVQRLQADAQAFQLVAQGGARGRLVEGEPQ